MEQRGTLDEGARASDPGERTVPLARQASDPQSDAGNGSGPPGPARATGTDSGGSVATAAPTRPSRPGRRSRSWPWRRRAAEERRRGWVTSARVPLTAPVRVVVAAPKGGVGKTTVALALAEQLAALRADRVGVLDAQPLGGTAGLRIGGQRGRGLPALLAALDEVTGDGSYTAWSQWATIEHDTRVTVFGRSEPLEGAELSIDTYRRFVDGKPKQNRWRGMKEIPARTPESDAFSKDLKRRGFSFVGSTIIYAHMQAVGMVNDHVIGCFRRPQVARMR